VDHDIDRARRGKRPDQSGGDAAGGYHRDPGVETDDLDVIDPVERRDQPGDPARRQHKRVAAGDDDLPDLGPAADIGEGAFERGAPEPRAARADLLAAEAIAAIDRADEARL